MRITLNIFICFKGVMYEYRAYTQRSREIYIKFVVESLG